MLIIPAIKADTAETPASSPGIPRVRSLKNVSPPPCPNAPRIRHTATNKKNAIISPVDHLPIVVLGLRLILMLFIYWRYYMAFVNLSNETLESATEVSLNNLSKGSVDEEEEWNRGIPPAEVARAVIGSLEKDEHEIVIGEVKGLVRGARINPEEVFKSLNEW
jgi:hypothetical protein